MTRIHVREAFKMYQAVTHDDRAGLSIVSPGDGDTRYAIINGKFKMHAVGAKQAVRLIETWVDGYRAGQNDEEAQRWARAHQSSRADVV